MTIIAYAGLPGHGKSYSAVENVLIPALKDGRTVVHNLKLKLLELRVVTDGKGTLIQIPEGATPPDIVKLGDLHPGAVWLFDEIWQYWGGGLKVSDVPKDELSFFKRHRHSVNDKNEAGEICIIDQELGSGVARFIRDLVELTYIHKKLSSLGSRKKFRVDVYSKAQSASKVVRAAHIREMFGQYKPEIWNCYESHTQRMQDFGVGALEKMPDDRGSVWKSWQLRMAYIAIPVIIAMFLLVPIIMRKMAGPSKPMPLVQHQTIDAAGRLTIDTVSPVAQEAAERPPQGAESKRWRYAGRIIVNGVAKVILEGARSPRFLLASACKSDDAANVTCMVDGERVTEWTGPEPTMIERITGTGSLQDFAPKV